MAVKIYGREISPRRLPYFIAEVGANHDGDIKRALRLIGLAADAGADAVKFQHFAAETIVSRRGFEELGQKVAHQAAWKESVYEVYQDAAIPLGWTEYLAAYCHDHGMAFITTPYSLELADAVEPYVDAYKIGSGDVTYHALISHVAAKGKPVLLATGASDATDVDRAVGAILDGVPDEEPDLVLMQCTTDYAGGADALSHLNLRAMPRWSDFYGYCRVVGLSDHTPGHIAVCAAVALGAAVIEKHFTDDPQRPGPDHSFAMTMFEWRSMVEAARATHSTLGGGEKRVEKNEVESRVVQRRALRYSMDIPAGGILHPEDVIATRPCPEGALEPYRIEEVLGCELKRPVEGDTLVRLEDFEQDFE